MVTLLSGAHAESDALLVALSFRVVTLLGEVAYFLTSFVGGED